MDASGFAHALCYCPIQEAFIGWTLLLDLSSTGSLELPSSSPHQFRRRLKTFLYKTRIPFYIPCFLFAGPDTDAGWERCWFEWRYTDILFHFPYLHHFISLFHLAYPISHLYTLSSQKLSELNPRMSFTK